MNEMLSSSLMFHLQVPLLDPAWLWQERRGFSPWSAWPSKPASQEQSEQSEQMKDHLQMVYFSAPNPGDAPCQYLYYFFQYLISMLFQIVGITSSTFGRPLCHWLRGKTIYSNVPIILFFLVLLIHLFVHLFDCLSCHLAWESGWKKTSLRCLLPGRHGSTQAQYELFTYGYILCVIDFGVSCKIHIFVQCPHILWTYFLPHRKANPKDKKWEEKAVVHSNYTGEIHFLGSTATNNIMEFLKSHIYPETDSWVIKPGQ